MTVRTQRLFLILLAAISLTVLLFFRYYTEAAPGEKNIAEQILFVNPEGIAVHPQTVEGGAQNALFLFLPSGYGEVTVRLPAGWKIALGGKLSEDGDQPELPAQGKPDPFSVLGKNAQVLLEGTLTSYQATGIGSLHLNVRRGTLDAVHADTAKTTSLRAVYEARDSEGHIDNRGICTLRGHGNLTWQISTRKKPYALELDQAAPLLSMGSQTKWALLSNHFDSTQLMNRLALTTAQELACPFTPELTMVNLYIDGIYRGLYQLVQRIGPSGGTFDRDDVRPAWLAEFDWYGPQTDTAGFHTELQYVTLRHPKDAAGSTLAAIRSEVTAAEASLLRRDEHCTDRLALSSFVRQFLLEEVYMDKDADFSSQFIYRLQNDDKIYAGPAWDFDQLLGTMNWTLTYGGLETHCLWIPGMTRGREVESGWLKELYELPSFREAVRTCYTESFEGIMTVMTDSRLPAWEQEISSSVIMDRTCSGTDDSDFRRTMDRAVRWLRERQAFFHALWTKGEDFCVVTFATADYEDNGHDLIYHIRPGESLPSLPGADGITGWQDESGLPVEIGRIITEDLRVLPVTEQASPEGRIP